MRMLTDGGRIRTHDHVQTRRLSPLGHRQPKIGDHPKTYSWQKLRVRAIRLGIILGFNPPMYKDEPAPETKAFLIALAPAPS